MPYPLPSHPFWSFRRVLNYLASTTFSSEASADQKLKKAMLLTTEVACVRVSQLYAIIHFLGWTSFALNGPHVLLAPSPMFLAKRDGEGHHLDHFVIPSLFERDHLCILCLVLMLHTNMDTMAVACVLGTLHHVTHCPTHLLHH